MATSSIYNEDPVYIDGEPYTNVLMEFDRDLQQVYSASPERDPNWSYTDDAGHTHEYVVEDSDVFLGEKSVRLPDSIERVVDYTYWCEDCRDEHEATHLQCVDCGEHINPGTRGPSMMPKTVAGPMRYTFTVPALIEERDVSVRVGDQEFPSVVVGREISPDGSTTTIVTSGPPTSR